MAVGGSSTKSYSWGTGQTWCRCDASVSNNSNGTTSTVTVSGDTTSGNSYNNASMYRLSGYGVQVTIGHNGGNGTAAGSKTATGNYNYNNKVASTSGTWTFNRAHSAFNVTCYTKYAGKSVNGSSAASNSGQVTVTVTIPKKDSWTVSYNANGGSGAPGSQTKWKAENLTLSTTKPTRTDWTFEGWATSASGSVAYQPGATYTGNAALTLYAIWSPNIYTPRAPSNLSAKRNSDTSMTISWGANYTDINGHYPWTGIYVDRATDSGGWTQVASLSWSATSWTDTSTSANHRYIYRARSYNAAGTGTSNSSSYLFTTPAAPSKLTASKPSTTAVDLTCGSLPLWYDGVQFRISTDGSTWTDKTLTKQSTYVWRDTTPPSGTVWYACRTYKGSLYSGWTFSNSVLTVQAPNAPTIATIDSVYAIGSTTTIKWTKNHPDGTAQTKAQVEITTPDGTATTYDISGATASYTLELTTTGIYGVRVRTYGLYDGWGAWSAYTVTNVYELPQAYFETPQINDEALSELPYSITWSITDHTGVSYQQLTLTDAYGAQIVNTSLDTDIRAYEIDGSYGLANNSSFTLTLYVRAGSSLTTTTTRTFTTDWVAPAAPIATIETTDDYAAHIIFGTKVDDTTDSDTDSGETESAEDESGISTQSDVPETVSYSLIRISPDGTRNTICAEATEGQEFVDWIPPLNTEFQYLIISYAESGVTNQQEFPCIIYSGGNEVFNLGTDGSEVLKVIYDTTGKEEITRNAQSFHFALGDETENLPTIYPDGDIDVSLPHTYTLNSKETYKQARAIARNQNYALCWFRDFWGNVYRVFAQFDLSYNASSYNLWELSVNMTENKWEDINYANE